MAAASLRALLGGIIDYAGLFPPAKLPMPDAIEGYRRHKSRPESWMVDKFICPVGQLGEMPADISRVSATGKGGTTREEFYDNLLADASAISRLPNIISYEVRVPSIQDLDFALEKLTVNPPIDIYLELPLADDFVTGLQRIKRNGKYKAKIRTGGTEASAFPEPAVVAEWIAECVRLQQPFKATAGLHHPLRQWDETVKSQVFGFLNIFCTVPLVKKYGMVPKQIEGFLVFGEPTDYIFGDDGFTVRGLQVDMEDILEMRKLVSGFGSCSVDEPVDDLKKLGLL